MATKETKAYLYLEGLYELAHEINGDERIFVGIRPYDLHAGNVLSIVAYPFILCEAMRKRGTEPTFTFLISINDWEQSSWYGKDIYTYPFDIRPEYRTIAHTISNSGEFVVDKWQPVIEKEIYKIKQAFPNVVVEFVRNSSLKQDVSMRHAVMIAIKDRRRIKQLLLDITGSPTLGNDTYFANAVCSRCFGANTNTKVSTQDKLHTLCNDCGLAENRVYEGCDYWLHYKLLFPPRLNILNFQISISGADHLIGGDFDSRQILYKYIYRRQMPPLKMLFAPLIVTNHNEKMSKSRNNHFYKPLEEILPIAKTNYSKSIVLT